jgi:hypothetical protein
VGAADVAANAAVVLSALALLLAGVSAAYRWLLLAVCATCALHLYRTLGVPWPMLPPLPPSCFRLASPLTGHVSCRVVCRLPRCAVCSRLNSRGSTWRG